MQGVWSDVHTMLIGYIRDELGRVLPDDLIARAEENISLSAASEPPTQPRKADVALLESEAWKEGRTPIWTPEVDEDPARPIAQPILVEVPEPTPRWVEIQTSTGKLVTVIEILSPANKTKTGREEFERKVRDLILGGVSVVEIDLIRGGRGARDVRQGNWPDEPCQILVGRPWNRQVVEVYPCPLRDSLPVVGVPLRESDADATLDLQPLLDRCYEGGRYWMLPYQEALSPALSESDFAWTQECLAAAGLI